jgi:hypothetical protein
LTEVETSAVAGQLPEIQQKERHMTEVHGARAFMRLRLGEDWEFLLMQANAMPIPGARDDQIGAAQQRAMDLVSETCADWSLPLREAVAVAWRAINMRCLQST